MSDYELEALAQNPDLFVRLAENALVTARELRDDYVSTTLRVARSMRQLMERGVPCRVSRVDGAALSSRTVAFVDGGLSRVDVEFATPLIVRAGIFRVKEGESDLAARETFAHYPLFLGELEGGLKAESSYGDVVRLIVELGALLAALSDPGFSDVSFLMLHGPLVFLKDMYSRHWFFESDLRLMLGPASVSAVGDDLVDGLSEYCAGCPKDRRATCTPGEGQIPAVCIMTYLQSEVIRRAADQHVVLCGVVERPEGRGLTRSVLEELAARDSDVLEVAAARLRMSDASQAQLVTRLLEATRYTDALLLAMTLRPGESLSWMALKPPSHDERLARLPAFKQTFVRPNASKYPIRVEVPADYTDEVLAEVVSRCYGYASLLPNYAFPLGLDIVDKYTAIPSWMSNAYHAMILSQYARILSGDFVDLGDLDALIHVVGGGANLGRGTDSRPEA